MAPSDDERLHTNRSPTVSPSLGNSVCKDRRKNNDSQESLFYSSSTCREDTHRSPRFNMPILESEKHKVRGEGSKSLKQRVYDKIGRREEEVKEEEVEVSGSDRLKELEYALEAETLASEELRSKVNIMTKIIEQGWRETELAEFLNARNSSKNKSKVDIFVELEDARQEIQALGEQLEAVEEENTVYQ